MSRDSRRQSGTPAFSHTPPQNPGNGYGPGTPQHPGQQHSGQQFPGQQFQAQQFQGQQFHPGSQPNHPQGRGPKQKKPFFKRVWVWLLIVVVAIIVIASMSGGGSSDGKSDTGSGTGAAKSEKAAPAGLNTPVKDGDVEFTVTSWKCGVKVEGPMEVKPQGQFCEMKLTAKNIGTKQVTLSDSNLKVVDAKNAEYRASSETWMVKDSILLKQVNPGNTLNGVVYYDVPTDVSPTRAMLAGSLFSKGTTVALG